MDDDSKAITDMVHSFAGKLFQVSFCRRLKNLKNQIILEAIEKQNCRLVLLEMPLEASLAYNRFIHDEQYVIDSLLFPGQLIDPQMQDLLGNLRLYNSRKKEAQ